MLLAIDIGNTNIVYGMFDGRSLAFEFRVESVRGRTRDEYAVVLHQLLGRAGLSNESIHHAIIASVVPPLTDPLALMVKDMFGIDALIVGPGIKSGMPILYDNPREVGADRIVNAVAAYERTGDAVIVVDFGTATTFDCVSKKGEYLGGVIAPGIQISADALFSRAAKLPRIDIVRPKRVLGKNTVHSIQSGLAFGYVGLVDGIVERLREELPDTRHVMATGGFAPLITELSRTIETSDPALTLEGLRILFERNT